MQVGGDIWIRGVAGRYTMRITIIDEFATGPLPATVPNSPNRHDRILDSMDYGDEFRMDRQETVPIVFDDDSDLDHD